MTNHSFWVNFGNDLDALPCKETFLLPKVYVLEKEVKITFCGIRICLRLCNRTCLLIQKQEKCCLRF